jgi:hypothetical protein
MIGEAAKRLSRISNASLQKAGAQCLERQTCCALHLKPIGSAQRVAQFLI